MGSILKSRTRRRYWILRRIKHALERSVDVGLRTRLWPISVIRIFDDARLLIHIWRHSLMKEMLETNASVDPRKKTLSDQVYKG
jgi:hypothetical protein